jgi:hypothetical protein
MAAHPEEACVSCHFFVKRMATPGGPFSLDVTSDERSKATGEDFGWVNAITALSCHKGIWDEGYLSNREQRFETIVTKNRDGDCFYWPHHPGMLLPAAEALQARETVTALTVPESRSSSMDTVLTWSGEVSHVVASFFRSWLTEVLPGIEPWISSEDIAKGKKWFPELMGQLSKAGISITFVTPENIRSPWVYYEVGAIAAKNEGGIICPYLIGVEPSQVRDTPLGQFQCTAADPIDTFRLISSINDKLGAGRHNERLLKANFDARWPELVQVLEQATRV